MTNEITILTPEHVELKFELAGIGSRFIALLIDTLLQGLILIVLGLALFGLGALSAIGPLEKLNGWLVAVFVLVIFIVWSGYFLYFEATKNGQTPGKKSVGIQVILDTGHPIDFRAALLRNVLRIADSIPAYGVGVITMWVSPQYRRLGDYVAGTLVVRVPRAALAPEKPEFQDERVVGTLLPEEALPHLGAVTKEEFRTVRHFLDRQEELAPGVRQTLAQKLAEPLGKKLNVAAEDPIEFLEALRSDWERKMIH
ncbi:MAG: RDD family protein [Armatimonadota bacterium]